MQYKLGTKLIEKETENVFIITSSTPEVTKYTNGRVNGECPTSELAILFDIDGEPMQTVTECLSALDRQIDGDHYKTLGQYQPWEVLRHWLTPEEFRGYMKGTAIAYLARERQKGETVDIKKAAHTLEGLVELLGGA